MLGFGIVCKPVCLQSGDQLGTRISDRKTERKTERQTERQRDRQKDGQTDGQTDNFIVSVPTYLTLSRFCKHSVQIKMYFLKLVTATERLKGKQPERQTDIKTN